MLDRLRADTLQARQNKDTKRMAVLVPLLSDVLLLSKEKKRDATEEEIFAIIRKYIAGLDQTLNLIQHDASRQAQIDQATYEWELLNQYLPIQLTDAKLRDVIREFVAKLENPTAKDMGKIMSFLKSEYTGKYDGSKASSYVKEILCAPK